MFKVKIKVYRGADREDENFTPWGFLATHPV